MKSERIHIRIKPEEKAKLQEVADKKRRTITSLIEEMIENLLEEEMTTYIVVTSDGKDEWIEHESTDMEEAKRIARIESERNEKAKQKYTVEVREMTYVPGCDLYDCNLIDY